MQSGHNVRAISHVHVLNPLSHGTEYLGRA